MDTYPCSNCPDAITLFGDQQYVTILRDGKVISRVHARCYHPITVLVTLTPDQIPVVEEAPQYV